MNIDKIINRVNKKVNNMKEFSGVIRIRKEGKLELDSLLKEYVDVDNFNKDITIKHLLTHTSGLPDYFMKRR